MINDVLVFLKNNLNAYMSAGRKPDAPQEDQVVFMDGQNVDSLTFKLGAVSVLLVNLEQENTLRAADPYVRLLADGTVEKIQPDIRLNLYVLFVAHYQQYEDALRNLSLVIQYFQSHRLITHQDAPELSDNIEKLVIELVTMSFSDQNEVWGSLRSHYHPSVFYKVKMVTFQSDATSAAPSTAEKTVRTSS